MPRESPDKAAKRSEETYRRALAKVLETPEGRRVLWRVLESAGIYRSTFAGDDTHRSAMLEGRRSMGLELFDDIMSYVPGQYPVMQRESLSEESEDA